MTDDALIIETIEVLRERLRMVDATIPALERLQEKTLHSPVQPALSTKRGRKSMTAAERQEVSARMRKYWGSLRAQREAQQ